MVKLNYWLLYTSQVLTAKRTTTFVILNNILQLKHLLLPPTPRTLIIKMAHIMIVLKRCWSISSLYFICGCILGTQRQHRVEVANCCSHIPDPLGLCLCMRWEGHCCLFESGRQWNGLKMLRIEASCVDSLVSVSICWWICLWVAWV